jgi:hypothetical protein
MYPVYYSIKDFLELKKTAWMDVFIDGMSLVGGNTDPPIFAAFTGTVWGKSFSAATTMSAHGTLELPHEYVEGTDIDFHIHWSPLTATAGTVLWSVDWSIANANSAFPLPTTSQSLCTSSAIARMSQVNTIFTIPGGERRISDIIYFRISRLGASDTMAAPAFLNRAAIHVQVNAHGSDAEFTKSIPFVSTGSGN